MKMELIEKDKNPTFSYFLGFIHFPTFQDLSISSFFNFPIFKVLNFTQYPPFSQLSQLILKHFTQVDILK